MSGRRLPEGYNEIGRWTLNQASVKELLLFGLVGLFAFFASLAAAGFIVWAATGSAETTIDGGTFFSGLLLGGVLGVILHEAVHGVFFLAFGGRPRFGFKPCQTAEGIALAWEKGTDELMRPYLESKPELHQDIMWLGRVLAKKHVLEHLRYEFFGRNSSNERVPHPHGDCAASIVETGRVQPFPREFEEGVGYRPSE